MFDQTQYGNNGMMGGVNPGWNGMPNMNMGMQNGVYPGTTGAMPGPNKVSNNLTPEEINFLRQDKEKFNLGISNRDHLIAICNHHTENGESALRNNIDGTAHCTICGEDFTLLDNLDDTENIAAGIKHFIDILQNIKYINNSIPKEASSEYFNIIPLMKKIPTLANISNKEVLRRAGSVLFQNGQGVNGVNMFNNLNAMFGGATFGGGFQQPPQAPAPNNMMMGYPNQAYQAPNGMPGQNAFGYAGASQVPMQPVGQPVQNGGYQTNVNGYAFTPNQPTAPTATAVPPQTPAAPVAPAQQAPEVKKDVTV